MNEMLDQNIERSTIRKFNNTFALISLITILVFVYLTVIKLNMPDIFMGVNGLIIILTVLVCVFGYIYGYMLIKSLLRRMKS